MKSHPYPLGFGYYCISIISALYWLEMEERKITSEESSKQINGDIDWFDAIQMESTCALSDKNVKAKRFKELYSEISSKINSAKSRYQNKLFPQRASTTFAFGSSAGIRPSITPKESGSTEEDFGLDDYVSDDDEGSDSDDSDGNSSRNFPLPQVLYCSRTHSQISQFISEISKTKYSSLR